MITARLGLRARLYLASASILMLFAFNVATHLWGSYARSESVMAYRIATEATGLVGGFSRSGNGTPTCSGTGRTPGNQCAHTSDAAGSGQC